MEKEKKIGFQFTRLTKKLLASVLVLSIVFGSTVFANFAVKVTPKAIPGEWPGDVNGDGKVELQDVQLALKASLALVELTEDQLKRADLDDVGLTNADVDLDLVLRILKIALNLLDHTPWPVTSSSPKTSETAAPSPTPKPATSTPTPTLEPATPTPSPTPKPATPTPSPAPTPSTSMYPATPIPVPSVPLLPTPAAELKFNSKDIINQNADTNDSTIVAYGGLTGNAIRFGTTGTNPTGVLVTNPVSGYAAQYKITDKGTTAENQASLRKIRDAFRRTGVMFDGWTVVVGNDGISDVFTDMNNAFYRIPTFLNKEDAILSLNNVGKIAIQGYPQFNETQYKNANRKKFLGWAVSTGRLKHFYDYINKPLGYCTLTELATAILNSSVIPNDPERKVITAGAFNLTSEEVEYLTNHTTTEAWFYTCIQSPATKPIPPEDATADTWTYPMPTWDIYDGLSISMWVKAPGGDSNASQTETEKTGRAPLLTFTNVDPEVTPRGTPLGNLAGGLVIYSNGDVAFRESMLNPDNSNPIRWYGGNPSRRDRNSYTRYFAKPEQYHREWVYQTVVIQNDGVQIYYNGVTATNADASTSLVRNCFVGGTNTSYFNLRFGPATATDTVTDPTSPLYNIPMQGRVQQWIQDMTIDRQSIKATDYTPWEFLLMGLPTVSTPTAQLLANDPEGWRTWMEELKYQFDYEGDWQDYIYSLYAKNSYGGTTLAEYVSDPMTQLYIGGAPSTMNDLYRQVAANKDVEIAGVKFYNMALNADQAMALYRQAVGEL